MTDLEYWQSEARTAYAVIKQLTEGPGEIILIHPFDMYAMLKRENIEQAKIVKDIQGPDSDQIIHTIRGKKYRETTIIYPSKAGMEAVA